MENYIYDWLAMLLRWLHVITAIAWIGASFYFVWLDNSLEKPASEELKAKGVDGELWAVHGGGFYNPQKYMTAPKSLPKNLHWFYWESYATWMSGFGLFVLVYLYNADTYLIDHQVFAMTPTLAVTFALGFLVCGWLVYDLICRVFSHNNRIVAILVALFIASSNAAAAQIFAGRGFFLLVGAMLATIMSANVLFWIIPGQRKVTVALQAGKPVDPIHGQRGKQRSVHNTYLTLPVLFCMLSNHFAPMYMHPLNWVVLSLMMLAGVLIRQFYLLRQKGQNSWGFPASGIGLLALVFLWTQAPRNLALHNANPEKIVTSDAAFAIVQQRCYGCHSLSPKLMAGGAPKGIVFESEADLEKFAAQVFRQAVELKTMPLGNITNMPEMEREKIAAWYQRRTLN